MTIAVDINDSRPVAASSPEITKALLAWSRLVLEALPGGGKTTLMPRIALDAFPDCKILITEPRRLAAIKGASRIAEELGTEVGDIVGYRVGKNRAGKGVKVGRNTRIEFMTDAMLMNQLHRLDDNTVLILDEVHVRNRNMSALLAIARKKIRAGSKLKLVVMSATLPTKELSEYLDDAPIVSVEGTMFDVHDWQRGESFEGDIISFLENDHNVLAFEPGQKEIKATVARVSAHFGDSVIVLPLYGELPDAEQRKCLEVYDKPVCIVATDIAETSLTIPGITAVIDRGTAKVMMLENGIERLKLVPICRSRSWQRRGRAGRVCEGYYVDWCPIEWDDRPEFDVPETLRLRLEQTVLHLAMVGVDAAELEFLPSEQPEISAIREAKKTLRTLDCVDLAGEVTDIGRRVADLPVSVQSGRMLVEAEKLGVLDDVVTAVALIEQGGVNDRVCGVCKAADKDKKSCDHWRELVKSETESDVMAQHTLYQAARSLRTPKKMFEKGISSKSVGMVDSLRQEILDALDIKSAKSTGDRDAIMRAVCAGMVEHLYVGHSRGFSHVDDQTARRLDRSSVVDGKQARWLVGQPSSFRTDMLTMATKVDPFWLPLLAPHLVERTVSGLNPRYDAGTDEVVSTTEVWVDGKMVASREVSDPGHPEALELRRNGRNQQQFRAWNSRPAIQLPDLNDTHPAIPDVVVAQYGTDSEDGTPLQAYGTVVANPLRKDPADPYFLTAWTRDLAEAQTWHDHAVTQLPVIQDDLRLQAWIASVMAEKDRLLPLVSDMVRHNGSNADLGYDLRSRVLGFALQPRVPGDPQDADAWNRAAARLLGEVNAALADAAAYKAQAAARLSDSRDEAARLFRRIDAQQRDEADRLPLPLWNELVGACARYQHLPSPATAEDYDAWIGLAQDLARQADHVLAAPKPTPAPRPAAVPAATATPASPAPTGNGKLLGRFGRRGGRPKA